MVSLTAKIALAIASELTTPLDIGDGSYRVNYGPTYVLSDGTGANQAKEIFTDTRTLAASANESLDLSGGLTDVFGNSILFTKIKGLIIVADAANTNDVIVGGAASNGFISWVGGATHTATVKPGGMMAFVAPDANGYAVMAGTADLLKIANSGAGTGVNYTIVVVGVA